MTTKFKLCWWEDNGYHDSYFYGVYFDTEDGKLHSTGLGATAYGGGIGFGSEFALPTPEVLELARKELAKEIFAQLRKVEDRDFFTPEPCNVKKGRTFRLLVPHSFYPKGEGECPKCNGTGHWVHPRNSDDKRQCFCCKGTGLVAGKGAFLKGTDGKRVKVTLPAGAVVTALFDRVNFFGTQYAKGYNRPHRFNTSVTVKHGDALVRVPLEKLRQDAEPASDAELMDRADELSYNHQYGAAYGCKAWLTENWAADLAEKTGKNFRPKPCPTGAVAA
jgi:hypothetical protein